MRKNAFVTFCFACVPGCGQMYQGYMKRGVSLLFWFALDIAVMATTRVVGLGFMLFVIWAYSFFDSFNLRNLSPEQRAVFVDTFIPNIDGLELGGTGFERWRQNFRFTKAAGWGLIALGAIVLFTNFRDAFITLMYNINPELANWIEYSGGIVFGLAIGAVIVLLGIRMLRGPKQQDKDDDIHEFRGGDHG